LENLHKANAKQVQLRLEKIQDALENEFIWSFNGSKIKCARQITALFEVGGQYRRNM
jgi:hypothetical protein